MITKELYDKFAYDVCFHQLLASFDHDLTRTARRQGCDCGGKLHAADYPRKPRGVPASVKKFYCKRLSLCCARDGCRGRTTPASVRFLGRRAYVAVTMLLISVMVQGGTRAQLSGLSRELGVDRRTIARWRKWWRTTFVQTRFWRVAGAAFMPPVDQARLPASLLGRFSGAAAEQLFSLLRLLLPITAGATMQAK